MSEAGRVVVTRRMTLPAWVRQAAAIAVILCTVLALWSVAATLINPAPEVGWARSAISRSNVVLPQPDGPISEMNSPRPTASETSDKAWNVPLRDG